MTEAMDYGSIIEPEPWGGSGSAGGFDSGGSNFDSGDPFEAGIQAAERRLSHYGLQALASEATTDVVNQAREALASSPAEFPSRGIELFVELVIVGAAARENYGEDRMTQDDISAFLRHLIRIENSWFHSPP